MNKTTRRILTKLLQDKSNWAWHGKQLLGPKLSRIQRKYWKEWETLWIEEIYLDQITRAYHLFYLIKKEGAFGGEYKDIRYARTHFGKCDLNGKEQITLECDNCLYQLQQKISSTGHYSLKPSFVDWWLEHHSQWQREEITEEIINEMEIKPHHQLTLI